MKGYFLFIAFLLFSNFYFFGQNTSSNQIIISGKVIDAETNEPLEYATITIQAKNDSIIAGTSTNKNGRFKLQTVTGKYTLKIQFLSFKTYKLSKVFADNFSLGVVNLIPDNTLNEVEIIAEKKLLETKFNKKIYNASADIANIGGNAIDVLNNTPSVRVDDEGAILIRGGSVTVLVDGKPQFGLDNNTDILKAIPSSSIDKVEIITRSAKYSAEGGGGAILNIITKKRQSKGLNGSVEAHTGIPDNHGISTFVNEDTNNMNLYSTISINNRDRKKYTNINQPLLNFDEHRVDNQKRNSFLFNLGSDFYLNDKNTLSTSFLINTTTKNFRSLLNEPDFIRDVDDYDEGSRIEAMVGYKTNFNEEGHSLSIDFKYENTDSENNTNINEAPTIGSTIFQKSEKNQELNNFLAQIDYSLPFTKDQNLELGYKGTFRFYDNDFNVSQFDTNINDFITIGGFDDLINYDEKVNAFYALYNATHNKLSYSLGLRAEISDVIIGQQNSNFEVTKNYTDFFPSATLGYEINDDSYISLNYSRSIDRPSVAQINPFIAFTDERFQTVGNQNLNPFYTNYLEILYDKSFKKLTLTSSFFLNFASDQFLSIIENTGEQTLDGQDIFRRIPINSGDKNSIGIDLDLTYRFSKNFRLNTYVSPYRQKITNAIDPAYNNSNTTWYITGAAYLSFNNGLKINARHIYQSPIINGLTELRTIHYSNITLSKSLFKKKATLAFKITDVFSSKKFSYESFEANTLTLRDVRFENQYQLTFTYRFNQKRRNSKDRSRDINKDDLEDKQDKKL